MEGPQAELSAYPLTRPMHYTSGTTGRPKGVTTGVWDEATAKAVFDDEAAIWQFDARRPPPGVLADVPHGVGALRRPGRCSRADPWPSSVASMPRTALEVLRRLRPTTTFLVPTHLQRILTSPDLAVDEAFDSLRFLAHAGAPCPPSVKRATMARVRPGGGVGVLRLDRGPVHRVRPRRVARPSRHGGSRPARPAPQREPGGGGGRGRRRLGNRLVRHAALRPLQLLGRRRGDASGLAGIGLHRR